MENIYLLYGQNKSIIKEEINKIIEKINSKDIIKYSLDNTLIKDIIEDANTISMFSNKKIIIVNDSSFFGANKKIEDQELLEKYLNNYNNNTYIIFVANIEKIDTRKKITKIVEKNGSIIECLNNETYTKDFINNYLAKNKYKMQDTNYFLNIVGNNLENIKNELEKLIMYKINDKIINNDDIDKICIKNIEEEIFELTDAIIANNKQKSINLLNEFLNKNYEEIAIIALLASQFRFLYQVKRLENKNKNYTEIAKILEVNPYRVKFTQKKLYNYREKDITERIKQLAKMDHDIKLGLIDKKLALELFILN